MGDWSAVYLHEDLGASPALAGAGFAAFSLAMAVGRFSGDHLAARLGPARLLALSGGLAAVGLAAALLIGRPGAAIVGAGLVGLGLANSVPVLFGAAGRMPGLPAGAALAAVATTGYGGFLAGPPAIGIVAETIGLPAALGLVALACALTCTRTSRSSRPGSPAGRSRSQHSQPGRSWSTGPPCSARPTSGAPVARAEAAGGDLDVYGECSPCVTSPPRSEVEHGDLDEARPTPAWAGTPLGPAVVPSLGRRRRPRRHPLDGSVAPGDRTPRCIEDVVLEAGAEGLVGDVREGDVHLNRRARCAAGPP